MKRFLLIPLAALIVLAAGCSNVIDAPKAAVESETGSSQVLISLGAIQARTLLPDLAAFHYTLTFTATGKTTVYERIPLGDPLTKTVTLDAATWTLRVDGFINEAAASYPDNALVTGIVENIVVSATGLGATVTVDLEPTAAATQTGTGSLTYTVKFPAALFTDRVNNKAAFSYSRIGSTEPVAVDLIGGTMPADTTGTHTASGTITLDAGYYLAQVYLYDHANKKEAARTRVAHVYKGAATLIDHDLSTLPSDAPVVSFNTQGGNTVAPQSMPRGSTVPQPANPARTNYTFGGWYKEAACTTAWKFADAADPDTVATDTTLYAKWISKAKAITGFSIGDPFSPPWELQGDGRRKSPVIGDNQITKTRYSFTTSAGGGSITIKLYASSESNYDWAFVGNLDSTASMTQFYERISGTTYASTPKVITISVLSAGDHFIEIGYGKDSTQSSIQDCAWFEIVGVSGPVQGVINEGAKTISAILSAGTNLNSLAPTITVSPGATVSPASGVPRNFTSPVTYTVTAENGDTAVYTVTVLALSNAKAITGFNFMSPAATGDIDEMNRTISISVPYGTNLGSLAPTITVSPAATVSPPSGAAQSFISPVTYTVTAENGDTAEYTVTVTARGRGEVTLIYPADAAVNAFLNSPIILSKSGASGKSSTQTLTVNGEYDIYRWRVDGTIEKHGKSFVLNAANYTVGIHQISLEVTLNGVAYSKFGSFRVEN